MTNPDSKIFIEKDPEVPLDAVILTDETRRRMDRIIKENLRRELLIPYNLRPKQRVLFHGSPGTGKTLGAEALAYELKKPLYIFNLESLAHSSSESALNTLGAGFKFICETDAVFLFDEFDAIAAHRGDQSAGQEGRRVVNDLLVHFETFTGHSIVICATNFVKALDAAFRRRFDTICQFNTPSLEERQEILIRTLHRFEHSAKENEIEAIVKETQGLSIHEVEEVAKSSIKRAIVDGTPLSLIEELQAVIERKRTFRETLDQ